MDPIALGVLGLEGALARATGAVSEEFACIAIGEALLWAVAVDDARLSAYGDSAGYRDLRDADWNGQLMPALRWARNSVVHELVGLGHLVPVFRLDVTRLDDDAVLGDGSGRDHEIFWPYLDSVDLAGGPSGRTRAAERWQLGREAYVTMLEGRRVVPILQRAAQFLAEGPTGFG